MRIRILGGLELESPSREPLRLPTRKTSLLLAALVLAGEKGARRQSLCEALWPDRGEAQARSSLRQALAAIRRVFPHDDGAPGDGAVHVEGDLETLRLVSTPDAIDAWRFDQLALGTSPADLAAAADLYHGDVLAGVALPEPLDQWFGPYQRTYRRKALQLVEQLSLDAGRGPATVQASCQALAERLLAADPTAEEAHRALMRVYQSQGHLNAAIRQFELCRAAVRRELQVEPEALTENLAAALREDRPPGSARASNVTPGTPAPVASGATALRDRGQPSIIVMPFDNLSGAEDEYFVDGVVEEITSALSRVREFFVIARQSAFTYKGRFVDVREIRRELGVNYVVEGTVRRGGDRLRISVQLVDAETRAQLWSDRYEGGATDIFEFQDRIAAQVAGAIYPAVRNAEIDFAGRKPPGSLGAYDLVLQAYPRIWSQNPQDNAQAIATLQSAIAIDPAYGRAHALLAWCHSQNVVYLWSTDPEGDRRNARRAVDAAAGLIGDDPTAMTALGAAISQCLEDLPRAASYIEGALALDPNNAWAWARHAWVALYQDEPDQAMERFERSLALSPLDPLEFNIRMGMALALSLKGQYAQSANLIRDVLNKHPNVTWAYRQLAYTLALAGDLPTARDAIRKLLAAHPNTTIALMKVCHPSRSLPRVFDPMLKGWRLAGLPET
ncbi:MAG: BTAD domain-containing putative transcriptional regulator [Hyphomicrobiaceae bacterium]